MKRKNWTDAENAAIVALYFRMRAAVDAGEKLNKAALIREARAGALCDRSRGSVEAKLMNVSGALADMGREDVSLHNHGYKAASAYQKSMRAAVAEYLGIADEWSAQA